VQTFFLEWPSLPDDFRNLTRVPTPNLQIVKALSLFGRVQQLFAEEFHKKGIAFSASVVTENLEITADSHFTRETSQGVGSSLDNESNWQWVCSALIHLLTVLLTHGPVSGEKSGQSVLV
jgi:hypothetical protein